MYALGVSKEGAALLRKQRNQIIFQWAEAIPKVTENLDLGPSQIFSHVRYNVKRLDIKPLIVTGLEASRVVRRELSLKLKKEKEILAVLPFQVENLIPFPPQETILQPQIYPEGEVVLFATQKSFLRDHLKTAAALEIEPDQVSCTPCALHRWGMWRYPDQKNICIVSADCCIVSMDGRVAVAQSFQDRERMVAFVKNKYPEIEIVKAEEFAIPIGLALEGLLEGTQFRQEEFTAPQYKNRIRKWQYGYIAASLALALATFGIGEYQTGCKEKKLNERLSSLGVPPAASLSERIDAWEKSLTRSPSLAPVKPLVSDLLAWLSKNREEIDVTHLHYLPTNGKVEMEFKAPSPTVARAFHELLSQGDNFVDTKQEISWNVTQDRYKTTFYLK